MQAISRQPQRAPDGTPVHYERHRPEETTLYRLVQQHAATFFAQTEAAAGADLPQFVKDEFDAFLECGILAQGFLRLHCGDCGHDKLVAFSCKRRGFCPSCGARRMAQTAAHLVDHVIPHVPVRQWVLIWVMRLPIPLRLLLAAQPKLVTPVLQVVHRVITRHLLGQAGLKPEEADSGAVTLIQRFGSPCRPRLASGQAPRQAQTVHWTVCVRARPPTTTSIYIAWCWTACTGSAPMGRRNSSKPPRQPTKRCKRCCTRSSPARRKLLTRRGVLVEEEGSTYMADNDGDSDEARVLRG